MSSKVAERVWRLAKPLCAERGLWIWDVEYVKEGTEFYLRVYIDGPSAISADDCEAVSRALDPLLDGEDIIDRSYIFEVCSPGIERRIKRPEHFEMMAGRKIRVRCFKAQEGKKEFVGVLLGGDEQSVTVETGDGIQRIDKENISACNAVFDF